MRSKHMQIALLFSLLLHFAFFFALKHNMEDQKSTDPVIEISFVEDELSNKQDLSRLQIVDQTNQALNDEIPEDAKYLGKNNQKVQKETAAREHGTFNNAVGGKQTVKTLSKQDDSKTAKPTTQALKTVQDGMPTFDDLKPKFDWSKFETQESPDSQRGVARTNDYLKDMEEGVQTLLSTREFVYYSYYSRIKDKLQQYWEPKIKEKMSLLLKQGRTIASTPSDRVTQVIIVLDERGILQKVQIVGESGITDLDDAAVEAFKAAAPFPNPPKGIIEKDGTVKIRWDFVLEA